MLPLRTALALASSLVLVAACQHSPPGGMGAIAETPDRPGQAGRVAEFARFPKIFEAKISPGGTHLAVVADDGGRRALAFVNLATRKMATMAAPGPGSMVGTFFWVNDQRVIVELVEQDGTLAVPVSLGELYAVDADGGNGRRVFGYLAGARETGSHLRRAQSETDSARVVSTLRHDPRHVYIETRAWREVGDRRVELAKLDVYTGVKTLVGQSPIPEAQFVSDENGEPRLAAGFDAEIRPRFFFREPARGWRDLVTLKGFSEKSTAVGFSAHDLDVYVVEQEGLDAFALYAVNVGTGLRRHLATTRIAPPDALIRDGPTGRIVALESQPDRPRYDFLEPGHPIARVLRGLQETYPSEHVRLLDRTDDGKLALVEVYSDRRPGQFLLVHTETLTAELLFDTRPWIRPELMSEMTTVELAASDGFRLHGYLTVPRSALPATPVPMVVLPHGGPHFVRDVWGFDTEAQLLASEGFAVLQINYRGSGGYGWQYQEAGYRKWGGRVVQDIVDATRWVVRQGWADPERLCIYGASFGAYAALQSTIVAPALFRCAVGLAGIYDLELLPEEEAVVFSGLGRGFLRIAMGGDEAALRRASPVYNADKIRARVLLIHGEKDSIAPIEHAELLRKALVERGHPPEWLVEPREGHGFYGEAARTRMYTRLVEFLKENTEKRGQPAPGPDLGSSAVQ